MPPERHALLSASSCERWLNCPPSARLCEKTADQSSDYAAEGTDAHSLCEYKLLRFLGREARDPTEDLTWYSAEMEECAEGYVAYIAEILAGYTDPLVLVEQRVDFSRWVPQGFGTSDALIIADGTMHIVDYKHGAGVQVEANDNPQLKCYALGALEMFGSLYDIDTLCLHIYQPRRQNTGCFTLSREELLEWADGTLRPAAELAYAGRGEYRCGGWCGFCKAKSRCRARAEANLELARFEFKKPPLLSDAEIAEILIKADELSAWAADVSEYALREAINGRDFPGWKLVEGRANRRYTDESAVAKAVLAAGYEPYEEKLLGVTAMQRMLGRKRFDELIGDYIERPQGRPTLVPESDKRPAMDNIKKEFTEDMTNDS